MFSFKPYPALLGLAMLLVFARPAMAFGAGNIASISKVEGENCEPPSDVYVLYSFCFFSTCH